MEENIPVDRIEKILNDYLRKTTSYAIMLTGSWGAGKTHYIKNTFLNNLADDRYKGIVISLFGVKTIDDIKEKIFMELHPFFDNKYVKMSTSIFKAIFKSVDLTSALLTKGHLHAPLENATTAVKEISGYKTDFVDFERLLICFDDLERVNKDMLTDNQILGYINSLVEDNNIKVIVIANEGKIEPEAYKIVKEKTIGNTIHFYQNFSEAFENILSSHTDVFTPDGLEHLRNNRSIIYNFLKKENQEHINYRTLTYFLSYYQPVCHFIQSGFEMKELDKLKNEILSSVLKFSLMICVEYKKGKISYRDKKGLDDGNNYIIKKLYDVKNNETKNYGEELIDLYYPDQRYEYYESIYDYLTGGDYFDKEKFISNLCKEYHIQNEVISEAYKLFNKLSNIGYLELSDKEYIEATRQLKIRALNGEYDLQNYLSLFYCIVRNGNVLNINPQLLVGKFKKVIIRKGKTHKYSPVFDRQVQAQKDSPYYEYYSQLIPLLNQTNENANVLQQSHANKGLIEKLENNYNELHDHIVKTIQEPYGRISLSGIDANKLFRIFMRADNYKKSKMLSLIVILYSSQHGSSSKEDLQFIANLENIINNHLEKNKPKNVSGTLIEELHEAVKKRKLQLEQIYSL
ncbi:MAG: hypothetical protein JWR50_568 [Mucilaginibacter sp.]|nr:hypothetical protein [Mucilaginibacter sp.]